MKYELEFEEQMRKIEPLQFVMEEAAEEISELFKDEESLSDVTDEWDVDRAIGDSDLFKEHPVFSAFVNLLKEKVVERVSLQEGVTINSPIED